MLSLSPYVDYPRHLYLYKDPSLMWPAVFCAILALTYTALPLT